MPIKKILNNFILACSLIQTVFAADISLTGESIACAMEYKRAPSPSSFSSHFQQVFFKISDVVRPYIPKNNEGDFERLYTYGKERFEQKTMTDKEYTFLNLAYAYCLTANIKLFHTIDPGNRPSDELEFSYFVKDPEKFSHLMSLWDKRSKNDTIKIIAQKIGLPEEKRITISSVSFITSSNIVLPLFSKTGLFSIKRGLYCRRHKVTCLGLPFTDASYDGNPVTGPFQFSFHDIGHAKASNILDSIMDIIPVDEEDMYYFSRNTRFITSQKEEQDFSPIFNELYDALEKQPETGMKRQAEGVLHMIDHEWYSLKRNTLQKVQSQKRILWDLFY
ncbi:MAG: hypothetical protein K2X98_04350 [Alphaproteobacteria bacterium]|nr:hypothetical protein [Alphaproteobacteria bacterium]